MPDVEFPQWEYSVTHDEPTNDHRAARALAALQGYRKAYYWHLGPDGEPDEPLGVIVQDLITDLFHLADHVSEGDDDSEPVTAAKALQTSWDNYEEEVAMERRWDGNEAP